MRLIVLFVWLYFGFMNHLYAQDKAYRSATNELYWKNRKPDAAYWQQDVHYIIKARIDEVAHSINATEELEYWNNSPVASTI